MKYLIKTTNSIWNNPLGVYDLKRDLLLYDKVGMLNYNTLLQSLHEYKQYPYPLNALNELEFLIDRGFFVELKDLAIPLASKGTIEILEDDLEIADHTMKLVTQINEEKNIEKRNKLWYMHDELNTRLWCSIVNSNNEDVFTVPSLKDYSSFEIQSSTKQKAYNIIHRLIPLPDNETPWEKIFEFKEDSQSVLKLLALKNWINDLPDNIKKNELADKIHYLVSEYTESLKRHKIHTRLSTFKTIVNSVPTALTEIVRLKFDKAVEAFFSIAEQQVNFNDYKERSELKGNELAYISHVNIRFKKNSKKKK
ncbi:hypothetical protein [Flavobacterium sp. AG291]|uniref:hypothetical protein n=1 Tax=Flavobacterium sp. AG291 TaxID=2184000 RepID=UPI000E0B1139|nr:hypothetical protein [Flavobacterium sp. AG291]RDI07019.1 hypothetical protein DEU42_113118 [Flavobacterium sp. AG291]